MSSFPSRVRFKYKCLIHGAFLPKQDFIFVEEFSMNNLKVK